LWKWICAAVARRASERVHLETRLCYFLGYLWERQRHTATLSATPATIPPRSCAF